MNQVVRANTVASASLLQPWLQQLRSPLGWGLLASMVLHGLVMAMHFKAPEPILFKANDPQIEIILLNAGTQNKPLKPEVLAQLSMEGGGDREKGRAKSPLAAEAQNQDGDDVVRRKAQIEELEAQQRRLVAMVDDKGRPQTDKTSPKEVPQEKGVDPTDTETLITRMQAEISKQIEDYNKRPKRMTYGVNALGVSFAQYVDDWSQKVEAIGTARYPEQARGKMYDSLILTVEIDKFGNVVNVIFNQKSKYEVLNKAARETVYAGAPYNKFTPEMIKQADILQIVRTWYFTNNNEVSVEAVK